MSKGGGSQKTTTKSDPWGPAQNSLKGGLGELNKWYASDYGRDPYPGSTVVPFSPFSTEAFGMAADRARAGSPIANAGKEEYLKTLQGDYLDPETNPWLSSTFDLAAGKVRSALDSQFNKGSTYGSSLHTGGLGDTYNNLATSLYGGNYQTERSRQWDATTGAPGYAENDYNDANHLLNVGQAYEGQAQKTLQDSIDRYNFYNEAPLKRLMSYFNIINPVANAGSTSTQTTPSNTNDLSQILGTVASVAAFL